MVVKTHLQQKLGSKLKERRLELGRTTEQVSKKTRIKQEYINDIEENDYDALPSEIYLKGFLRNYATYLDLDPDAILKLYKRERQDENFGKTIEEYSRVERIKNVNFKLSKNKLTISVILISVIIALGFFVFSIFTNTQKPHLQIDSPFYANVKESNEYKIDINESEITLEGEIGIGNTLYLNNSQIDTLGLSSFELPIEINDGENVYILETKNQFGISSKLKLLLIKT